MQKYLEINVTSTKTWCTFCTPCTWKNFNKADTIYSFLACYIDVMRFSEHKLSFKNAHTPSCIKAPLLLRITLRHTNIKATVCSKTTCFAKFRGTLRKKIGPLFFQTGPLFFQTEPLFFQTGPPLGWIFSKIHSRSGTRKLYDSCAFSSSYSVYENGAVRNVNLSHVGFYKMFVETFSGAQGAEGAACFCYPY